LSITRVATRIAKSWSHFLGTASDRRTLLVIRRVLLVVGLSGPDRGFSTPYRSVHDDPDEFPLETGPLFCATDDEAVEGRHRLPAVELAECRDHRVVRKTPRADLRSVVRIILGDLLAGQDQGVGSGHNGFGRRSVVDARRDTGKPDRDPVGIKVGRRRAVQHPTGLGNDRVRDLDRLAGHPAVHDGPERIADAIVEVALRRLLL